MSTWTLLQNTFTNAPDTDSQMMTDGTYLYYYNAANGLTQYTTATDIETEIYTDGTSPIDFLWDFTIFGGNVYILGQETTTGHSTVWSWDGTPNNWTEVTTITENVTAGTYGFMAANDNIIAAVHVDYNETANITVGKHSSDGTSWSASTFETDPIIGTGPAHTRHKQIYGSRPIVQQFCVTNNRPTNTNCLANAAMVFASGGWTDIINPTVDGSDRCRVISPVNDQLWTWAIDGVTARYAENADDNLLNQSTPDADIEAILSANTNRQFGIASDGGTGTILYQWAGGWSTIDTLTADVADRDGGSGETSVCVLDDNSAYMLLLNLNTATIEIWERDEILPLDDEIRLLGMATDGQSVYITGDQAGILKLLTYQFHPELSTALVNINSVGAGGASYAELDARTRGIFPACKLNEIVYLRGRDGINRQLQYSDDTGSTLTNATDGAWGSAKYAVGLFVDPINPDDMVIVFDDNDIYRTQDGGTTWTKTGDAAVVLREAARHMLNEKQLLLAGQAAGAGQLFWTPNYGVSSEDVSDAGLDIINHIERSYGA